MRSTFGVFLHATDPIDQPFEVKLWLSVKNPPNAPKLPSIVRGLWIFNSCHHCISLGQNMTFGEYRAIGLRIALTTS
jgi:hypothetical protein